MAKDLKEYLIHFEYEIRRSLLPYYLLKKIANQNVKKNSARNLFKHAFFLETSKTTKSFKRIGSEKLVYAILRELCDLNLILDKPVRADELEENEFKANIPRRFVSVYQITKKGSEVLDLMKFKIQLAEIESEPTDIAKELGLDED